MKLHNTGWMIFISLVLSLGVLFFLYGVVCAEGEPEPTVPPPPESEAVLVYTETSPEPTPELPISPDIGLGAGSLDRAGGIEQPAGSDPYFFIGATKYSFMTPGSCPLAEYGVTCFEDWNTIQAAIDHISSNGVLPTDRRLYVESGTYDESVSFGGSVPFVNQLTGLIGEDSGGGLPVIDDYVYIHDMPASFTISGFIVNANGGASGAVYLYGNSGTITLQDLTVKNVAGDGVNIENHNGAIVIDNVVSSGNYGSGLYLFNQSGTFPVTITNSEFDQNDSDDPWDNYGIYIGSHGLVTLNYVSATHNNGTGARIWTEKGIIIKNSTFSLNYADPDNTSYGYGLNYLVDITVSPVYLENVTADGNERKGIYILTSGNVAAKMVSASGNGDIGMTVFLKGAAAANISGSQFNDNSNMGLYIKSLKNVTINSINAIGNSDDGVNISNCEWTGSACEGNGTVTIAGTTPNRFSGNGDTGLRISSGGAITLTNFEASGNGNEGAYIYNNFGGVTAGVTVNANYVPPFGTFINTADGNGSSGVLIISYGAISMDRVLASTNGNGGIQLDNHGALTLKTVMVKNSEAYDNSGSGIIIDAKGNVVVTSCDAYDNTYKGLEINNSTGGGSVSVGAVAARNFTGNDDHSIEIGTSGTVTLNHVDTTGSVYSLNIINSSATSPKSVSVSDVNVSGSIFGDGLSISSVGPITVRNIIANDNSGAGIYLYNPGATLPQPVTLSNAEASGNDSGIRITSKGNVTLSNLKANSSTWIYGLEVNTCYDTGSGCTGNGNVTLAGTWNEFNHNTGYGMEINAGGNISLANFEAMHNTTNGVELRNYDSSTSGSISISASAGKYNQVLWNGNAGINLYTSGTASVSRTTVENNKYSGLYIQNDMAASPKAVTVSDSAFNHNQYHGLEVRSDGTITLKGVTAIGNSRHNGSITSGSTYWDTLDIEHYEYEPGRYESWWFNGSGAVTVQVRSTYFKPRVYLYDSDGNMLAWDDNSGSLDDALISTFTLPAAGDYRIEVAARNNGYGDYYVALNHDITVVNGWANSCWGAKIGNAGGSGDVIIQPLGSKGNTFTYNSYNGLNVTSYGNISATQVDAHLNGGWGVYLENDSASAAKNVTLAKVSADCNRADGVRVESLGAITWNGGGATGNVEGGAVLDNHFAGAPKPVTVSNAGFFKNMEHHGLTVVSLGNITINSVGASANIGGGANGLDLNNCILSGGGCTGSGSISVSGTFGGEGANYNQSVGIYAQSSGNITVKNFEAAFNGDMGAVLDNSYIGSTGDVAVSGTAAAPADFSGNLNDTGLYIMSLGNISLSNVRADNNQNGYGIDVDNEGAASPKTITLNKIYANYNGGFGIAAGSLGAISATSVQTNGNKATGGMYLFNRSALSPQLITVSKSESKDNTGYGMHLESEGKITLNAVNAMHNTTNGLQVWTNGDLAILSSLGENTFNRNAYNGIRIIWVNNTSLSKVTANDNGEEGMETENANGTLTINTASFQHNGYEGIDAHVQGAVIINKAQVAGNGFSQPDGDGIYLMMSVTAPVDILNSMVTGNQGSGIDISGASVTTVNLTGTFYLGNDTDNDGQPNVDWP